jgi:hypothetical protein
MHRALIQKGRVVFVSSVARRLFALILLTSFGCPGTTVAQSSDPVPSESIANAAGARPFDIPSQPLEDALYAFDAATGIEVFVDGSSVAGRQSAAIKGVFRPMPALRAMLAGTGLEARSIGPNAITLSLGKPEDSVDGSTYQKYSAFVQTAIVRALCGEPNIRPGDYRIATRLWLAPSGVIAAADLLSSTGDPMRDRRLQQTLVGIAIGRAPPPMLPQPVIVVILPRSPRESGDCG